MEQDRFADGTVSVTTVLRPKGQGWRETPMTPEQWMMCTAGWPVRAYFHEQHSLAVFSAVEYVAEKLDRIEYHISISKQVRGLPTSRCTGAEARWVLDQFGMDGVEEDNHVPSGLVRNYWRPVANNLVGLECPCKEDEPSIVEDKGDYIWRGAKR